MITPQDEQNLQRLLGVGEIPEKVLSEYQARLEMYHRTGNSGPLGPLGLIDLIRFLGLRAPEVQEKPTVIDWRTMPRDGSVRVEGKFFGEWRPGVYLGLVEHGTLAVRFDEDPVIRECQPHMLRLAKKSDIVSRSNPEEQPDARATLLEPKVAEPPEIDEQTPTWRTESTVDWSAVKAGSPVWVEVNDDVTDGFYVGPGEDGRVIVRIDGRDTSVVPDAVTFPGSALPVAA